MLLHDAPDGRLPAGPEWVYQPKLDGYRMMGVVAVKNTLLITRQGNDYTRKYPTVVQSLPQAFPGHEVIVDGEMVGFNKQGHPNLHALSTQRPNAIHYLFDLLAVDGEEIIDLPLEERLQLLEQLYVEPPQVDDETRVQLVDTSDEPDLLLAAAKEVDLEGIVAKHRESTYTPGVRSRQWLRLILKKHDGWRR
jgi:bifunctional non-homologous end joining protein LigD